MIKNIALPNIKLPSKRLLLIVAGAALVLCLLTVATVRQVQVDRQNRAAEAAQEAQAYEAVRQNTARIQSLETQAKAAQADKQLLCDYIKSVQQAKQTRGLITVPVAGHCNP